MKTQCTGEPLEFHALGRRSVTGRFDGGRISSDAGGVLLREVDKRTGVTARVSRYFVDYRNPASVEHSVHELVSQRVYAIALGYEDLTDHGELRCDAVLSLLVGKTDVTGENFVRIRCDDTSTAIVDPAQPDQCPEKGMSPSRSKARSGAGASNVRLRDGVGSGVPGEVPDDPGSLPVPMPEVVVSDSAGSEANPVVFASMAPLPCEPREPEPPSSFADEVCRIPSTSASSGSEAALKISEFCALSEFAAAPTSESTDSRNPDSQGTGEFSVDEPPRCAGDDVLSGVIAVVSISVPGSTIHRPDCSSMSGAWALSGGVRGEVGETPGVPELSEPIPEDI